MFLPYIWYIAYLYKGFYKWFSNPVGPRRGWGWGAAAQGAWGPLGSDFLSRTPGVSLRSKQVVTFVTKVGGSRNESTTSMPKLRLDNYGRGLYF